MVVRNNTAYSQTLQKKTLVAKAVAGLPVPKPPEEVQLLEGADEPQNSHIPRLTIRQRQSKMFNELDWVAWTPGTPSWQMLPTGSWPNPTVCSHWIQWNWAVPTPQNTWLKLQMTLPLSNNLNGFPHHCLKRIRTTCGKCWSLVLSGPARVPGTM